jgi:hypothetical protein
VVYFCRPCVSYSRVLYSYGHLMLHLQNDLLTYIKRRLAPQPVKIRADIEVTCFTYEGIDAIKAALTEGEEKGAFPDTYCMRPSLRSSSGCSSCR